MDTSNSIIDRVRQLTTTYAQKTETIDTLNSQREAIKTEIVDIIAQYPELFADRKVSSISGDIIYKVSEPEQTVVNKGFMPTGDLLDKVLNLIDGQVKANPADFMTTQDYKALGIKPTSDNIGQDKPFIKKPVSARFTRQ